MGKAIVSGAGRASLGVLASSLGVGTVVKLMEDGVATDFIVVNQGNPDESLYDASCGGVWLLRKEIKVSRAWHSAYYNAYATSTINTWLNQDYYNTLGSVEQDKIKQAKIPYCEGNGSILVQSGANGLSVKIFLLGGYELGWTRTDSTNFPIDGTKLSYFVAGSAGNSKRIAYLSGTATNWWTRTPNLAANQNTFIVEKIGDYISAQCPTSQGIRPALIIPSTSRFDPTTLLLKG